MHLKSLPSSSQIHVFQTFLFQLFQRLFHRKKRYLLDKFHLDKKVFLQLTDKAIDIAENNSCEIVELPRFNTSFDFVKKKYSD